jgi:hypothetical protein
MRPRKSAAAVLTSRQMPAVRHVDAFGTIFVQMVFLSIESTGDEAWLTHLRVGRFMSLPSLRPAKTESVPACLGLAHGWGDF